MLIGGGCGLAPRTTVQSISADNGGDRGVLFILWPTTNMARDAFYLAENIPGLKGFHMH